MAVGMAIDSASSGFKGQVEAGLCKRTAYTLATARRATGCRGGRGTAERLAVRHADATRWAGRVGNASAMRLLCVCMKALVHCNVLKVNA